MRKEISDIKSTTKKRRRVVTINDLLARDDVNDILQEIDKNKADIQDMIVIAMPKDKPYYFYTTRETLSSTAVWLLECVKADIIKGDCEPSDD